MDITSVPAKPWAVEAYGSPCPYCGEMMDPYVRRPSRDHIKPRSHGHTLAPSNRLIVCVPCNNDKGAMSLWTFAKKYQKRGDLDRSRRVRSLARILDTAVFRKAGETDPTTAAAIAQAFQFGAR